MNQFVEDYLKAVVEAQLTAESLTATVYTGTSGDVADPSEDAILCLCDDMEGVVDSLRLARCKIHIRTSAATGDRATHRDLAKGVTDIFNSPLPAAVDHGITELTINGNHVSANNTAAGENKTWVTSVEFTLGVNLL